uniref:Uncharacterized protein n=1 Tax=Anguilla anguilla TaxID=7936 RepID=A0A0E9RZF3_ANGAN
MSRRKSCAVLQHY